MNTKRAVSSDQQSAISSQSSPQASDENRVYGFWAVVVAPVLLLGWLIVLFWLGALAVEGYWGLVRVLAG